MNLSRITLIATLVNLSLILGACAGKTDFRAACASEVEVAWSELSIAKAEGFSGTVSYTKALSLITAARTMQTVENFDACYNQAKDARFYIRQSRQGQ